MKLSVIIVNYNVKYFVEQCLNSLQRALEGIESEIFVVDNHSRDDSVKYLSRRFRQVNIIDVNHNLGFSRANNIAIRQSEGEYVLLINPDTFVSEDALSVAVNFMDAHPLAGGLGISMIGVSGNRAMESRRGIPTPLTSLLKMLGKTSHYYMSYLPWNKPSKIEIISGAFCMLRREALNQVGLLDEDFFMYGEDIDLSFRLLKGGWENWYLPVTMLHYKGESTQKASFRYVHVFYNAMLIFFRKHYGHLSMLITLPIQLGIYFRAFLALSGMQMERMRRSLGFTDKRSAEPTYIFIGGHQMTDRCRLISRRKGLTAAFHCSDDAPVDVDGLLRQYADFKDKILFVFDIDTYTYADILRYISKNSNQQLSLGTFNNKTKIIITSNEILK